MNLYDKLRGFKAPELNDIGNMTVNEIIDILKSNAKHNAGVAKEVGKEAKTTLKQELDRFNQIYQDIKSDIRPEDSEFDKLIQTLEGQLTELKANLEDEKTDPSTTYKGNPQKGYIVVDSTPLFDSSEEEFEFDEDDIVVTVQLNKNNGLFEISFQTDICPYTYTDEELERVCKTAINDYKTLKLTTPATFCYSFEEISEDDWEPDEDDWELNEDEEPEQLGDMDTDEVINGMPFKEFLEIIRDDVEEHFNVTRKGKKN